MRFIPTFLHSLSVFGHDNKQNADCRAARKPSQGRRGIFVITLLLALAAFGGYVATASSFAKVPRWQRLMGALRNPVAPSAFQTDPLTKSAVQVDAGNTKTVGNTFGYRLTYNCGSSSGPCLGAQVIDLLPTQVQFVSTVPAGSTGDVAAINVTPNFMGSGRTRVQFVMINPLPAGNSGDLLINVRFPNGSTPDGTVATNTADGINLGTTPATFTTPAVMVTAVATVQANLDKTLTTSPANLDMPESYRLRIAVPNSAGALNLTSIGPVTDTLPPGTVFNGATPAADCQPGCVGTTPATVTWTAPCSVPLQPNQNCDINVNVTFPSANFPSGTNITNMFTADATPLGKPSQNLGVGQVTHPVTTFVPNPSAGFTKNLASGTPNPPTLNQTFSYDLNPSNNGNVPLDTFVIIDTLPIQMLVASVTTGAYTGLADFAAGEGIRVSYEKNTAPGVFTLWGSSPNTTTNTTLTAPPPGLGAGEYLTRIRWEYGQAQPAMSATTRPLITGQIKNPNNAGNPVAIGNTIQNCADLTSVYTAGPTNVNRNDCESFTLSGPFTQFNPAKENLSGGGPFNPGQSVSWRLRVRSAQQSSDPTPLETTTATDLLPVNLNFSSWTFDDRGTGLPAPQVFDQIPNYAGTGRTLLRWRWNAGSGNLGVNQEVWINISTAIRSGTPFGSLSNDFLLDSDAPGRGLRCSGSSLTDALDVDGDGDTAETLCRATGTITVASIAQLISSKTVQGACDSGFVSASAGTLPGGRISYRVRTQNVGTVPMQNFVMVDILPFVGDTGVRDANPRGSQFTPLLTEPITPPAGTVVSYSTSGNPCRGEVGGPTTACDPPNWSTVPPAPITAVRSFKIEFGNRVIQPFDFLEFSFDMTAPASLPAGDVAYNSFAYQANRSDGLGSLAAEPQKVGIGLGSCGGAALGDFVFADSNGNGIQDDGAGGINNVTMRLFAPGADGLRGTLDDVLLGTTVTANGPTAAPGWYRFPGLAAGNYFVCAALPPNHSFSPQDATGDSLDSDAAPATGCTGVVTLLANQPNSDVDIGLIPAQSAAIGNYVWFDLNQDGIQNESPSEGANGVTVRLYARNGGDTLVGTTITANDEVGRPGYYFFGGLAPGQQYFVQFVLPAAATSFTTANAGGDDAIDSDAATDTGQTSAVTLATGEFNRTLDAGLVKPTGALALGDQVWADTNNNGLFEPQNGELGIDGVLLYLYRDVNNNGLPDADEYTGQTATAAASGFAGRYLFSGLAPGTYIVTIPASNFAGGKPLAGLVSATGNSPAPDPDNDVNGDDNGATVGTLPGSLPVTLTNNGEPTSEDGDNNTNLTLDFGFTSAAAAPMPPIIAKAFGAAVVPVGGSTTLTFTLTNPNGGALTGIGVNDPLPFGLAVSTPNGLTGSCVGMPVVAAVLTPGTANASAGGSSISLSGLVLSAGGSCTLTVNTTVTASGPKYNQTGNVIAADAVIGGTASATLLTNSPPSITPANLARAAGSPPLTATIATAVDAETPQNQLEVQIGTDGINFFDSLAVGNVGVTLVDQNAGAAAVNPTAAGEVTAMITTPCDAAVGPLNLFLRVTDAGGQTDIKPWTLTITANPPPTLSYANQTLTAGTTTSFIPATGPSDNGTINPLVLQSITPATGLTLNLNPTTGQIGVTNATLVGNYAVIVSATDNCGAMTNAGFTVTVTCPAIALSPTTLPNAAVNTVYNQVLTAAPSGLAYSFAVTSGLLPAGLTLNADGSFGGAPAQSGVFNFRVTVMGGGGCTAFRDYVLVVDCLGISLAPESLPGGSIGTAYNQTVSASPAGSYNYSVTSGTLPPGLAINAATGVISGSPTIAGTFNFRIAAANGICAGARDYSVTINCAAITFGALPGGVAGAGYNQTISVSPSASYTFSLQSGSLPSGLTLNPATGAISGLPTIVGSYSFTVKAQTASGCFGTQSYMLQINCPAVNLSALPSPILNAPYNQTITASPAGGNYSFAVTAGVLPAGLSLNSATGAISGTPATAGAYNFTIAATGFGSCAGSQNYSGTIAGSSCPAITVGDLPSGQPGQLYSAMLSASPANGYSYAVTSGSLPPGLTLYGSFGLIFGYPTTNGTYNFTITATDANNCTGQRAYSLLIGPLSLRAVNDFDGDGKSDLAIWRGKARDWLIHRSSDDQVQAIVWDAGYDPIHDAMVAADYDGDGMTDLAVFRSEDAKAGHWFIRQSSDEKVLDLRWGVASDVPVPGDYDGDGKTDLAVWRGAEGVWLILRSSDGQREPVFWGTGNEPYHDLPAPADYDGDGRTDIAVFRQSDGHWYIKRSSDGSVIDKEWGLGSDMPVAADYDGDGKADIAVWRRAENTWYILRSSDGQALIISGGTSQGSGFDMPAPGDYDGDGKADPAVWRASERTWYVHRSRDGSLLRQALGQAADQPIGLRPQ